MTKLLRKQKTGKSNEHAIKLKKNGERKWTRKNIKITCYPGTLKQNEFLETNLWS